MRGSQVTCVVRVEMFGRLQVAHTRGPTRVAAAVPARRAQELLSYLVLSGARNHNREVLAARLWGRGDELRGRKYLRQSLWELQRALTPPGTTVALLRTDLEWIALRWEHGISSDVADVEGAVMLVRGRPSTRLDPTVAAQVRAATESYRGDLLEGWDQDWCVSERERLRVLYFLLVDRLMAHDEDGGDFQSALRYGSALLRAEPAHERTHERMMRLHYLLGDRTAALRQFQTCRRVLAEEMQVAPAASIVALYERIRADRPLQPIVGVGPDGCPAGSGNEQLACTLRKLCGLLEDARTVLSRYLDADPGYSATERMPDSTDSPMR